MGAGDERLAENARIGVDVLCDSMRMAASQIIQAAVTIARTAAASEKNQND